MASLLLTNLVKKWMAGGRNSRNNHAVWYRRIGCLVWLFIIVPFQSYATSMTQPVYPGCTPGVGNNINCSDVVQKNFNIQANSTAWIDTGISVSMNDYVYLNIYGSISIDNILPQTVSTNSSSPSKFYFNLPDTIPIDNGTSTETLATFPFVIVGNNNATSPTYNFYSCSGSPPSTSTCTTSVTTLTVPNLPSSGNSNGYLSPESNGGGSIIT